MLDAMPLATGHNVPIRRNLIGMHQFWVVLVPEGPPHIERAEMGLIYIDRRGTEHTLTSGQDPLFYDVEVTGALAVWKRSGRRKTLVADIPSGQWSRVFRRDQFGVISGDVTALTLVVRAGQAPRSASSWGN